MTVLLEPMNMAEEICRCDFKLKILVYPERFKVVTRVLIRRQDSERKRCYDESRDPSDVAMSQRMQEASRTWKRKGTDSFLDSPEGTQYYRHLDLSPMY